MGKHEKRFKPGLPRDRVREVDVTVTAAATEHALGHGWTEQWSRSIEGGYQRRSLPTADEQEREFEREVLGEFVDPETGFIAERRYRWSRR